MSRTIPVVLIVLVCIITGCNRKGPGPAVDGDGDQSLTVLQAKSGGELLLVPAGTFTMGYSTGRPDEAPHTISVGSFYLDRYPVTQAIYEKVMGVNPSKRKDAQCPV